MADLGTMYRPLAQSSTKCLSLFISRFQHLPDSTPLTKASSVTEDTGRTNRWGDGFPARFLGRVRQSLPASAYTTMTMSIRNKKDKPPADRATHVPDWVTALATAVMALLTVFIAIASLRTWMTMNRQLQVMDKQLTEMHEGGVDTRNLAKAANDQSSWTKQLADNMKAQADHTKVLADEALIQAKAAERSAIAAGSAADTAGENLRPWIKVAEFGLQDTAEFDSNGGDSIAFRFESKLRIVNVGHSPAREIAILPAAVVEISQSPSFDQVDRAAHRICWRPPNEVDTDFQGRPPYSPFMFPSESQEVVGIARGNIDLTDFRQALRSHLGSGTKPPLEIKPGLPKTSLQGVPLFLILCVRYQGVGINTYHTLVIRELWQLVPPAASPGHVPVRIGVPLNASDLSLDPSDWSSGDFAD